MSYVISAALQKAVFQQLDTLSYPVFDAVPSGPLPELYISIGPEEVRDVSDATGTGAVHFFTVTVFSAAPSFAKAKTVAAEVCDTLTGPMPWLDRGRLVGLSFQRARARRVSQGGGRQIELRFRARVEDS